MKRSILLFAIVAALIIMAMLFHRRKQPPALLRETAESFNTLRAERDEALREAATLRERLSDALRGRSVVRVDTLVRYDTIIPPPDTVLLYVAIDGDGRASVDAGVKADSGYVPESRRVDVANCDDGIAIGPSGVACNRAVLGHLEFFASVGAARETLAWQPMAAAGFAWSPSYRSTLDVSAGVDSERRLFVIVRKGVRLF